MSTAFSICCGSRYPGGHPLATSQNDCERAPIIDAMSLEQLPDEELVKQFQLSRQADAREQNVNELFRRNYARVARWCLRFADDRESAADLAQEVFAKAYQNLHSFQGQSKFTTWLFVIAKNHCLNSVRAQSRQASERAAEDGEDVLLELADSAPSPYTAAERKSSAKLIRSLLQEALDETEKTVFTLHYGEEVPLDVITRMLALQNQSGAKAYIVSAKRKLARLVKTWKARGQHEAV
jgi:RNA polymerase sigma-70 factor, ECF subfamily